MLISFLDSATIKTLALELINNDPEFRKQMEAALGPSSQPPPATEAIVPLNVNVDQLLVKEFGGSKITPWNTQDMVCCINH